MKIAFFCFSFLVYTFLLYICISILAYDKTCNWSGTSKRYSEGDERYKWAWLQGPFARIKSKNCVHRSLSKWWTEVKFMGYPLNSAGLSQKCWLGIKHKVCKLGAIAPTSWRNDSIEIRASYIGSKPLVTRLYKSKSNSCSSSGPEVKLMALNLKHQISSCRDHFNDAE